MIKMAIRSHSSGVGEPLSRGHTRMLLALRANVLAKGHSGITVETLEKVVATFNKDCLSVVPCKGTVGASGDLAPLSHLALGMMGEGQMWNPEGEIQPAAQVLRDNGLTPVHLLAKEGLALINGTQMMTSLGAEAVVRARNCAECADVACALTLEALRGTVRAFHPAIHKVRPHAGQNKVAARIRALLCPEDPSEIFQSHGYKGKVQDAYTLRCAPQVHGVANDVIEFVSSIISTEMNSATDNPMVFHRDDVSSSEAATGFQIPPQQTQLDDPDTESRPVDASDIDDLATAKDEIRRLRTQGPKKAFSFFKKHSDTFYGSKSGFVISGGNFHGEYPAKALDILAIGVSELASISERRVERLVNPSLSELPAFLVAEGGLNSGFMIAHCTSAALVSENKVLCHPASCDSISTSAAKEDHVSMGGFAARKMLEVVTNVETVIAIELLAACQALEFHAPNKSTPPLEAVRTLIRSKVAPWDKDRIMNVDIEAVLEMVRSGAIYNAVAPYLKGRLAEWDLMSNL